MSHLASSKQISLWLSLANSNSPELALQKAEAEYYLEEAFDHVDIEDIKKILIPHSSN